MRDYHAALDPLTDVQHAAFDRQCSAERADDWGKRTKAVNVLHDAERFATTIQGALDEPRGGLAYNKVRFRYLLEGILGLRASIVADRGGGREQGSAVVSAGQAHSRALQVRETLLERLHAFALGDVVRLHEISDALGSTKDDDAILDSLDTLSTLAKGYAGSGDAPDAALAESLLLDKAFFIDVAQARTDLADARLPRGSAAFLNYCSAARRPRPRFPRSSTRPRRCRRP